MTKKRRIISRLVAVALCAALAVGTFANESKTDGVQAAEKKKEALKHRLTKKQLKAVEKNIENLEDSIKYINTEALDGLKDWNKLWDKLKISRTLLENCGLTTRELSQISQMAGELAQKSEDEIRFFFSSYLIKI